MQGAAAAGSLEIGQEDTLPAVAQQLPSDPDERHRVLELQVVPGDPEQLTSPQAEGERHHVGGLQALALHFAQEGLGLLWRQRSVLMPWDLHASAMAATLRDRIPSCSARRSARRARAIRRVSGAYPCASSVESISLTWAGESWWSFTEPTVGVT